MRKTPRISDEAAACYSATEQQTINAALAILHKRLRTPGAALTEPQLAIDFCRLRLTSLDREAFLCVFLDTRHRVIAAEELFWGTVDGAEVHPRIVVKRAMELNAAAVLLAHNHPSGNPEFSTMDERLTARLKEVLRMIEVRVLDHILVAGAEAVSMARLGRL